MDLLAASVESTLKNLQDKRNFLSEQREHYIDIRSRLVRFINDNGDGEEEGEGQGMVFGDIIISTSKIYLSLGYEYYVEKTKEEAITFVDDKLKLMEDAIEQFNLKIEEAKKTLDNLNHMEDGNGIEEDEANNDEDFLPSMEIREELDDEGNVISSSVTPTTKQSSQSNSKKEQTPAVGPKEKGLAKEKKSKSFEENLKGKLLKRNDEVKKKVQPSKVDTENVYTFADLVQQMDQQDELEDGYIETDEINYDYDAFENSNFKVNEYNYEEDDEDEDEEEYLNHSIIPGFEAQSSFLQQIQRLRAQKQFQDHEREEGDVNKSLKPILKKSSFAENSDKKQKKKQVGFASSLEIHEVENLKEENKRQMQSFAVPMYEAQESTGIANKMTSDEFDGDLFAKMLGVQEADEVHGKYKEELINQERLEGEASRSNRRTRVSRFRKDRASKKENTLSTFKQETTRSVENEVVEKEPVVGDIIEKEPVVGDVIEKEPVVGDVIEKEPAVTDIVEREPAVNDIVERKPVVGDIIEKEPTINDIVEKEPEINSKSEFETPFKKKKLKSLQKPRSSKSMKKKFDPKILENISDDDYDDDDDGNKKLLSNKSKNNTDEQDKFPSKIQEVSRSMAKTGATVGSEPVRITNVDYHALGGNLDDMVKAYSLGLYDDDLEEDPGTIVEKLEDFKEYNKQVELLRDEIRDFQLENKPVTMEEEENDGNVMNDIIEHEFPESYTNDEDEVALHPGRLQEEVAIEYRRLKEATASKWQSSSPAAHTEGELEPIDKFGNPVKTSRFRSQRLHMDSKP
ncbi:ASG_G0016880.mRNA.1.CDS.1 [Saccharomyces cerevisiae]|nr:Bud27p [Saccharomyces cerevisiae YJM1078]AJU35601.1 Bud27p [Saccharomyces cerevisiae YJM244]AJU35704.1 Bud27p [Saccharomyces cerevisiae YJM248]AJU36514.1 Bud27p [Saccharomyces cerevisiae YJM453]AJU38784.1 Bud27p [Saccharomyces cerevisiae YJM1129]AJU39398.1 Bud27p [Saccharomyces cerevisiae YJM1242]AJU39503.1 Bud27p [Saccharomyces cerevisiae YJM1244]AJU39815.1 Bud27p [Saccharomyces cerevisiae YJM1252]AJV22113.1 Bud27p [Saccharomyces cerevisiae YJM1332]AJV22217.1 Bud27p [Saccharomyces cere